MSAEARSCNNVWARIARREIYTDVPPGGEGRVDNRGVDMERDQHNDSRFFESVLRRYVEAMGALHPDQARRDFFVYARQAKGFSERDAREWAKSQVEVLVTRTTEINPSDS
jgi:hypothetical protein